MLANELETLVGVAEKIEPQSEPEPETPGRMWLLRHGGRVAVVGLAIAMLTAGAMGGFALRSVPAPSTLLPPEKVPVVKGAIAARDWQDDLVIAHNLFSRESLAVGLESQANLDLLSFHLGNIIGTEVLIPDLGPFGLTFKRAQLLEREGIPIVQLAYLPLEGEPIALYIQWDRGSPETATFTRSDDVSAAQWRQNNLTYLLAGSMSLAQMEKLAVNVRTQIAERDILTSTLSEARSATAGQASAAGSAPAGIAGGDRAPAQGETPARDVPEQ